jgi:hypothetical protein
MSREKNLSPTPRKRAPRRTLPIPTVQPPTVAAFVDPERRHALIAEAAYYRAERRGFAPGHDAEDWLAAEAEVDEKLLRGASAPGA